MTRRAMTYDELLEFARRRPGLTLATVTGRPFRVAVYLDSLVFVPQSTTLGRSAGRRAHERFLAAYNESGSLRPGDYREISRDASYLVPLVRAFVEASTAGRRADRTRAREARAR